MREWEAGKITGETGVIPSADSRGELSTGALFDLKNALYEGKPQPI